MAKTTMLWIIDQLRQARRLETQGAFFGVIGITAALFVVLVMLGR